MKKILLSILVLSSIFIFSFEKINSPVIPKGITATFDDTPINFNDPDSAKITTIIMLPHAKPNLSIHAWRGVKDKSDCLIISLADTAIGTYSETSNNSNSMTRIVLYQTYPFPPEGQFSYANKLLGAGLGVTITIISRDSTNIQGSFYAKVTREWDHAFDNDSLARNKIHIIKGQFNLPITYKKY